MPIAAYIDAPLGDPVGAIFMRYATLAFETQPLR